jgi:pSer/pThr/pTyr-binding forkhead associated (FHA) protein
MQRVVRGHIARVKYFEVLDAIAEAERERVGRLENRRQEKEFANRLRAAQVAKERTKTWRCPRCPLSVAFKQRFTTLQEIEAHVKMHDEKIQREFEALQAKEAADAEIKRLDAMSRSSKEQIALAKMRRLMEERRVRLEIEALAQAKRNRETKVQKMNALFTIKYQRPLLPSLRKVGFKTYNMDGIAPTLLSPPYPELRLVRDAQRPQTAKWKKKQPQQPQQPQQSQQQRGRRSKKIDLLPEKIFITCTPFRFGRSSSCDSPLDCYQHSGLVSKDHALVFVRGSPLVGYTLVMADLHSTNGTFVNQQRIKPGSGTEYDRNNRTLEDGAIVVLGCTKSLPTPENPSGVVLSTVCYQLWKGGSGFHENK